MLLKGHFCSQIDFFFLIQYLGTPHVFKILNFDLKPSQILENVPSLVLVKSSTGIIQIVYRY